MREQIEKSIVDREKRIKVLNKQTKELLELKELLTEDEEEIMDAVYTTQILVRNMHRQINYRRKSLLSI